MTNAVPFRTSPLEAAEQGYVLVADGLRQPSLSENLSVSRFRPSGLLDWTFEVALILKGLDGLLEIVGGAVLLLLSKDTLNGWLVSATQHELSEDPNDFFYTHLLNTGQHLLATSQTYAALYLLSHGLVKLVLVLAVLRDKLWAYPWMMGFLGLFIAYQSYLIAISPSLGLGLLTIFDIFILWLTHREYGRRRSSRLTLAMQTPPNARGSVE